MIGEQCLLEISSFCCLKCIIAVYDARDLFCFLHMFFTPAGTGASCIYPLLGSTLNGWYFLATEVDDMCFNYAKKNVEQNNLSDLIKGQ